MVLDHTQLFIPSLYGISGFKVMLSSSFYSLHFTAFVPADTAFLQQWPLWQIQGKQQASSAVEHFLLYMHTHKRQRLKMPGGMHTDNQTKGTEGTHTSLKRWYSTIRIRDKIRPDGEKRPQQNGFSLLFDCEGLWIGERVRKRLIFS